MKATSHAIAAVLLVIGAIGCDSRKTGSSNTGSDPIDALSAKTTSAEYNETYWGEQRRNDSDLWKRATTFCDGKDGNEYPNCRPVLSLLLLDRTLDRPAASSPGFDGSMDMTGRADSARGRLDSLRSPQ